MSYHHHELTALEKEFIQRLTKWARGRYINYAKKKGLTYNQAINHLFRRPFEDQKKELDLTVDPEFHSSKEPVMIQQTQKA